MNRDIRAREGVTVGVTEGAKTVSKLPPSVTVGESVTAVSKGGVGGGYLSSTEEREIHIGKKDCHGRVSRPSVTATVTLSRRDSDSPSSPPGRDRHGHVSRPKQVQEQQPKTSWMHIGALNLLADHAAGIHVEPAKLELARRILGRAA